MSFNTKRTVTLKTFLGWGVEGSIGHKTKEEKGTTYVSLVWCKTCAKYKDVIFRNPSIKGATKEAAETYIKGTDVVTKFSVSYFSNSFKTY